MSKINEKIGFLGSSRFSVIVLDELKKEGVIPSFIITTPDKPQGRKLEIKPNVVKVWGQENNIKVFSPNKLDDTFEKELIHEIGENDIKSTIFIVASYGKIIPEKFINISKFGMLNIHPSLLPKYRGASPLQSAILNDEKNTGISIMLIDKEMDHGPIIAQSNIQIKEWPIYEEFEEYMAREGAKLLAQTLKDYISGKSKPIEQKHEEATYTKKILKEDALIDTNIIVSQSKSSRDSAYTAFLKIQAYHASPKAYFILKHNDRDIRVKITKANFDASREMPLQIERVIPEGSKEISWDEFKRGYLK
jgi:methionyl-tRNA formyltransferase